MKTEPRRTCDKCGKDLGDWDGRPQLVFLGEWQSDAAGGYGSRREVLGDLCPQHMRWFFERVRKAFKLDDGTKLLELWKEFVKEKAQ